MYVCVNCVCICSVWMMHACVCECVCVNVWTEQCVLCGLNRCRDACVIMIRTEQCVCVIMRTEQCVCGLKSVDRVCLCGNKIVWCSVCVCVCVVCAHGKR